MRVILHIGTEKTGSTSIQNFLYAERRRLMEAGVRPACAIDPLFGRNNFALVLASIEDPGDLLKFRKLPFDEYRAALRHLIQRQLSASSSDETLVFSSEHLSSRLITERGVRSMRALFPENLDFEIVCYVRPQHELFLGFQSEAIKAGRTNLDFADPRAMPETQRYGPLFFDYDRMLSLWEQVFGRDSILPVPFQPEQLLDADVVADFCHRSLHSERAPTGNKQNPRHNKSLSGTALFVLSCLNSLNCENRATNIELVRELDEGGISGLADREWLLEFYDSFSDSNSAVAEKYLGLEELFTDQPFKYEKLEFNDLEVVKKTLTKYLLRTIN